MLVYLPTWEDYTSDVTDKHRKWLQTECQKMGFLFFDLVEDIRKVPYLTGKTYFKGHYSKEGHRFIAKALYEKLTKILPGNHRN